MNGLTSTLQLLWFRAGDFLRGKGIPKTTGSWRVFLLFFFFDRWTRSKFGLRIFIPNLFLLSFYPSCSQVGASWAQRRNVSGSSVNHPRLSLAIEKISYLTYFLPFSKQGPFVVVVLASSANPGLTLGF